MLLQKEGLQKNKLFYIVDSERKILSFDRLVKNPFRLSLLEHFGLTKAIPKHWLRSIKPTYTGTKEILKSDQITITLNKRIKPLSIIQSQDLYWELMSEKVEPPSSHNIWHDLFPFLEFSNYDEIFERIFLITKEPALQTFQYKVINRIINCRYNLYKWKITDSPLCTYCSAVDTIEHHLFHVGQH